MANELRIRANFTGGLVDDAPLTSSATSLSSNALQALQAIGATQHMVIVLDPDGFGGNPEIAYLTGHTAAASTATLLRGQEGTTARAHLQDTPWVHSAVVSDYPVPVVYTVPTATAVTNTTLASYATPILIAVTVLAGQVVDVEAQWDVTCSGDNVIYWGIRRNPSTVLVKSISYNAGSAQRPNSGSVRWTDTTPGSGSVTYEFLGASAAGALTVYPSDSSTAISYLTPSSAGGTQIKATARWA